MCSEKCHWKILLLFIGIFHSTQAAWLRCYKGTLDNFEVVPLTKPQLLVNSTCINHAHPTIVFTFGYRGKVGGPATTAVLSAYLATKKRNVVLLDWEKEADVGILGLPMTYVFSAVPNAKIVGDDLGKALTMLARAGMNTTRLHLLGHSLGAHVMGYAGRRARENGHVVARITGLDPARALFEGSLGVRAGLDRKCARFVDIIHSDPGGYGTTTSTGTVDFWPNYAGSGGTQPGCPNGDFDMFSPEEYLDDSNSEFAEYYLTSEQIQNMTRTQKMRTITQRNLCSHDRSWRLFVESIQSPTAFPSAFAPDYDTWARHPARSAHTIYMGDLVNTRASGDYFLTTGPTSPYSLGPRGLIPDDNQTRRRRSSTLTRLLKYFR
ncbi:pancreatic triacylglycerol lipase-like isoform X1 [Cydia pomonella]|uniref:pancreatic triacylglycerol lipase-like isoform X1 n=1 Tax=Cydia pomonella TaxID=82600 RepID=UPI002ADD4A2C|nr:pancreatic triacylglycerol lipase-like isoform X1 [Cydia pomonella]